MAWVGTDMETSPALFDEKLSPNDIAEIEAAVKHFQGLGLARGHASSGTFPLLKELASRLRAITDHVYNGRGFHRIRGLDTSRYTEQERVIAYAGITSCVADERARNIDIDVSDILSMFIQSTPLSGGEQYIASISSVYNYLVQKEPEVLKALADDWYWERSYRPEGNKEITKAFTRPPLAFGDDCLQINFAATFVGGNPAYNLPDDAPPLASR
ncbi:hypothetical protein QQX98_012554 [Neonectria punicea]|uniref:Uncharacterized protein n=1 Tax=Neonectria punicea TaxID=979145 RepID=A0ABR1GIG3_9HYPO